MGRRRHRKAAGQRQVSELLARDAEPEFLYLTTTGRRTGRAREIEIWFTTRPAGGAASRDDGPLYVIAEHGENAAWVRNLRANPVVSVRVGARRFVGRARVIDAKAEPELYEAVRARMIAKYRWGDGLVVEISPETTPRASASSPS